MTRHPQIDPTSASPFTVIAGATGYGSARHPADYREMPALESSANA